MGTSAVLLERSVPMALLGLAVLVLPGPSAADARLRRALPPRARHTESRRHRTRPALPGLVAVSVSAVVLIVGGWPDGAAVAVPASFAAHTLTRRRLCRARRVDPLRLAALWDLLAACLRSGLPVPAAVGAVARDAPTPVAAVLRSTGELLSLGASPAEAWAPARHCPDTAELARAACRTARSGTALAGAAAALAARVRESGAEHAEARAQRAAVLITGPLGLCFLPAFLCLGVVPVVVGLASRLTVLP
jgi:Flp pilus assembly protein TadB